VSVLFVPLLLFSAAVVLLAALVGLAAYGPVGVVADVVLLVGLAWAGHESWHRGRRWWASTKAPELPRSDGS
jgi:hypothetical protein